MGPPFLFDFLGVEFVLALSCRDAGSGVLEITECFINASFPKGFAGIAATAEGKRACSQSCNEPAVITPPARSNTADAMARRSRG